MRNDMRYPNLREHVRAKRMSLVAAGLTILRAYFCARCPDMGVTRWGGFESWSRLIPHALVWAGAADPMGARRGLAGDQDADRIFSEALIAGWKRLTEGSPNGLTVKQAIDCLYPHGRTPSGEAPPDGFDDLREAIEMSCTGIKPGYAPTAKALGERLRRIRKRPIHGHQLSSEASHGGVMRWRVTPVS